MPPELRDGQAVLLLDPLEVGFLLGCVIDWRAAEQSQAFTGLRDKLLAFYPWPE